mmetsp:Transcript_11715/g.21210  ORF Transcript_11715/g.21210 Transcript_11715/m.21210 type:complete len:366 (+) Transcript_11715:3003-4100(+)
MERGDADREGLCVGENVAVQDRVNVEVRVGCVGVLVCVRVSVKEGERGTVGPVRLALVREVDAVNDTDADSEAVRVRVGVQVSSAVHVRVPVWVVDIETVPEGVCVVVGCKVADTVRENDRLPVVADCDLVGVFVRVEVRTLVSLCVALGPVIVAVAVPEGLSRWVSVDEAVCETDCVRLLLALWVRLPLRLYVVVTRTVGVSVCVMLRLRLDVRVPEMSSVSVSVREWLPEGAALRDGESLSGLGLRLPLGDGVQDVGVRVHVREEERVRPSVTEGVGEPGEMVGDREAEKVKVTVQVGETVAVGWTVGVPVGVLLVEGVPAGVRLLDGERDRVRVWEYETDRAALAEAVRDRSHVQVSVGVVE